jgi:hypothetical protein
MASNGHLTANPGPMSAPPSGHPTPAARVNSLTLWARAHPWVIAVLVGGVLVAIGAAVFSSQGIDKDGMSYRLGYEWGNDIAGAALRRRLRRLVVDSLAGVCGAASDGVDVDRQPLFAHVAQHFVDLAAGGCALMCVGAQTIDGERKTMR